MQGRPKKYGRQKDQTRELLSEGLDEDRVETGQRFTKRRKFEQQNKTARTTLARAEEQAAEVDPETLPIGTVIQVFSVYSEVLHEQMTYLAVTRKTMTKVSDTQLIVGDLVRFRAVEGDDAGGTPQAGSTALTGSGQVVSPQAVIEQILPRRTVLTRADSFKAITAHPIVANADQMLIVVSLHQPEVKWGLVDRMIVAAQSGGLKPIVCLNKVDLADTDPIGDEDFKTAQQSLDHYASMSIATMQTSVRHHLSIDELRTVLRDRTTVLAGHSGVGKSSLIHAVQPTLELRTGEVSRYTNKGRHTTSFARRYPLEVGGFVVDTPGVKLFGLWNVTKQNLTDFFPDVAADTAPQWRRDSFQRIADSLPEGD